LVNFYKVFGAKLYLIVSTIKVKNLEVLLRENLNLIFHPLLRTSPEGDHLWPQGYLGQEGPGNFGVS
jgi:hypothetical protein